MNAVAAARPVQRVSFLATYSRKVLAVSGFVMLGFVILHLGGNLLAFTGSTTFNAYARSIRELGAAAFGEGTLLLVARVVLAAAVALHVVAHLVLQRQPSEAPAATGYVPVPPWFATLPLSVLQATGGVIALFLVLHLAQLTVGAAHPAFIRDDPYQNMILALRIWPVAIAYVLAAAAVGIHLLAGTWTGLASLGLVRPQTERLAGIVAPVVALVVTAGMSAVPVAVLFGLLA
jgi:succinate dehydrogenase / fumarate reductase, cytochrome b subunit